MKRNNLRWHKSHWILRIFMSLIVFQHPASSTDSSNKEYLSDTTISSPLSSSFSSTSSEEAVYTPIKQEIEGSEELHVLTQSTWRDTYKKTFKDPKVIIIGTMVLGGIFGIEWINLYNQYPTLEANEAFAAMLNQTSIDISTTYWLGPLIGSNEEIPCLERYGFCANGFPMSWNSLPWPTEGRYGYFLPGTGNYVTFGGNISHWIKTMAEQTHFNGTYWLDKTLFAFHNTRRVLTECQYPLSTCAVNPDGTSISCGMVMPHYYCPDKPVQSDLNMYLTRGDATCAHNMVIQGWYTMMTLYSVFGGAGSLLFLGLWLIQFLL